MAPTAEQAAIIDACAAGGNLVIEAGAGTGKTTTLRMAAARMRGRGLYVSYTRSIVEDARRSFPANVTCSTAHALAFRAVGYLYKARLDIRAHARDVAEQLRILHPVQVAADRVIDPPALARLALETVLRFCRTADDRLHAGHLPDVNGVDGPHATAALAAAVLPYAEAAWAHIQDLEGTCRVQHDHYLKMWALSRPVLPADFVLLDEAQDADPLIASVVTAQPSQLIAVGDSCQAIFGWRGAVDAMANWPARDRLYLSTSWRFGPRIAEEANKWLGLLRAPLRLTGSPTVRSTISPLDAPRAVLCRTNGDTIAQAIAEMDAGRRTGLAGGAKTIIALAEAAITLQAGKHTDHPELFLFTSWAEVQEFVDQDQAGGADLATFVRLVDQHGAAEILAAAKRLTDDRHADVVISTAHKAKGREWPTVRIGTDFRQPRPDADGQPGVLARAEAMLSYVAVTRAKTTLDRGGLAWIDTHLADRNHHHRGGYLETSHDDW